MACASSCTDLFIPVHVFCQFISQVCFQTNKQTNKQTKKNFKTPMKNSLITALICILMLKKKHLNEMVCGSKADALKL